METPLLIPSFSSKGFQRADGSSAIEDVYRLAIEFVTGVQLVSAYDLHHGHLPRLETMAAKPELTVLDSGGYEIARDDDLSAVFRSNIKPKPWDVEALKHEHAVWPRSMPAIFVSYDNPRIRQPFMKQVQSARQLFRASPDQLHALLIKPESRKQHTLESVLRTVCAHAAELCSFDVVGVTEKELGATMLERMQRIAKLREALDEQGSGIPIHVFGALDPIACCVYFIAGAEIFDGLTWLRYAYDDGRCVYQQDHAALRFGIHSRDSVSRARIISENYYYLESLREHMKDFHASKDFAKLPNAQFLKAAAETLERCLRKGGS